MPQTARLRFTVAASLSLLYLASFLPEVAAAADAERPASAQPVPEVQLEKLKRAAPRQPAGSLFGPRSWEAPAPRPRVAAPVPPVPPQAPPLPFVYLGKWIEQGRTIVYLTLQGKGQNFMVRGGETLIGTYQVEAVEETRVILTYLPLNMRQTLPLGASPPPVVNPVQNAPPQQVEAEQEGEN